MSSHELTSVSLSNGRTLGLGDQILATETVSFDREGYQLEEGELFTVVGLEYSEGELTVHTDRERLGMFTLGDGTQSGIDGLLSSGRCRIISLREDPTEL